MSRSDPAGRLVLLATNQTYRQAPFVAAAQRLGLTVVIGRDVPPPWQRPRQRADDLAVDYRDLPRSVRQIEAYAARHPVGAILGLDDSGALLAAAASAALGLPHNSPEAVRAARDKHRMRQAFTQAGLPSPPFRLFHSDDEADTVLTALAREPNLAAGPWVIKPTSLAGSQGVMRVDAPAELPARWQRLRRILAPTGCRDVLVEAFIPGVEVALEGLLDRGRLQVLALFDKPDPLDGPFFEETIYVTPSRLPAGQQAALVDLAGQAAAALGLAHGPIHAELRLNEAGPWLVEVAARSIGGQCGQALRFGPDFSLEDLILRQACGLPVSDWQREDQASGVMMLPIPRAGIFRGVRGVDAATAVPLVEKVEISAPENYPLVPLPEGNSYLGFIFARGDTPAAVEAALRQAQQQLHFRIDDSLPVLNQPASYGPTGSGPTGSEPVGDRPGA